MHPNIFMALAKDEPKNNIPDIKKRNEYFTSNGEILSKKVPEYDSPVNVPNFEKTMVLAYCDKNEVAQIINALKNKKSVGHDGLSNEMLKHCSPVIEKYLSEAFNMSISKRKFPEYLKLAKVVPIFKKGDKTSPENYRPISLLCSISKIFEKLLYNRMVQFFVNRKLFASEQLGFRKKRSCVHAISTVIDYIREKIDKKSTGQACFINLQKAFDTLDHSILLEKLYAYGYRGPIFESLMDYLVKRYQYIETVDDRTDKLQINTGVPRGSILGPFLFLVYINDLPSYIGNSSKIAIFADDTSIVKAGPRNQCFYKRTWIE